MTPESESYGPRHGDEGWFTPATGNETPYSGAEPAGRQGGAPRQGGGGGSLESRQDPPWLGQQDDEDDLTPASSIRSYAWTGGRTKSSAQLDLGLETLVTTSENFRPGTPLRQEHQSVAELCVQPRSVAEISALLGVPFGVAKVLLADMAEQGLVRVHQTVTDSGSAPHLMLMERVLSGLRRL